MITENLSTLKIHKLTQEQYDRELTSGNIDETALYLTPEEEIDLSGYATVEEMNKKADKEHTHEITDVDELQVALDTKVSITRTVNGKALDANINLNANDVGAATPDDVINVQTNVDNHISNNDVHITADERNKLSEIELGAQKNTVTGVKGDSETSYRTGNINITKSNIGLGNVDNTSDANKPVSTAQQAAIDTTLTSAKSYTDTKTNGMATTTVVDTKISTHNTNTSAHSDIRELITGLTTRLNTLADSDDTTLDQMSEIVTYIKSNKSLIDSITTSKINVSDIVNNLTTNVSNKPLSAEQGVAIKALIDALQTAVNGKSDSGHTHDNRYYTESEINTKLDTKADKSHGNHVPTTETANNAKFLRNDNTWQTVTPENIGAAASSHGTHVDYSTTAPVMDGTASVGSASTVARSDHKHPTDTSRASKTEFDTHTADTTKHITSTERTSWNSAKTHADSAHAPSNAQANQNAFSNIKVGDTTISADTTTDTLTLVGSNVTITPDATNDKVTIAVASGSTSTKGIVQLTNSTSSTSTTTAATPNSVKSAYDLANTAKTNAATAQSKADSAYTLAESKVDSLSDLGITATATELNYMDGVTSNVQTQLNTLKNELNNRPVNNNILINSNFANPVNQRGYESGVLTSDNYTIDRWKGLKSTNLTLNANNSISIGGDVDGYLYQLIENTALYTGKTFTMSAKVDGKIYSATGVFAETTDTNAYVSFDYGCMYVNLNANGYYNFVIRNNVGKTITVEWAKLELGEVATTYVPRLYEEELELCQRYYQIIHNNLFPWSATTSDMVFHQHFKPMRITPTISIIEAAVYLDNQLQSGFKFRTDYKTNRRFNLYATKSSHGLKGKAYVGLFLNVALDAEL